MLKRLKLVLSNFRKFQFSAPIFGRGAWGSATLKPPKKLTHRVVLTTQLLTRNQNFLNISADTPPPLILLLKFISWGQNLVKFVKTFPVHTSAKCALRTSYKGNIFQVSGKSAWQSSVNIRSMYSVTTTPGEYKYVLCTMQWYQNLW